LSSSSVVSNFYSDNDSVKVKPKEEEIKTYAFEKTNLLPCDWSLKTRLRFLSTKPFSCNNGIKSSHESEAISNYSKFTSFYNSIDYCKTVTINLKEILLNIFIKKFIVSIEFISFK
jgi:hypothetical protein